MSNPHVLAPTCTVATASIPVTLFDTAARRCAKDSNGILVIIHDRRPVELCCVARFDPTRVTFEHGTVVTPLAIALIGIVAGNWAV